jgi:hypothetical protein
VAAVARVVIALALLLLGAPAARAAGLLQPAGPPVDDPQVSLWVANAARHFGRVPVCPGGITVDRYERQPGPGRMASAPLHACDMSLDPDWFPRPAGAEPRHWAAMMCTAVAHEYGHLLGLPHSRNPHSLMSHRLGRPLGSCWSPRGGGRAPAINRPRAWHRRVVPLASFALPLGTLCWLALAPC